MGSADRIARALADMEPSRWIVGTFVGPGTDGAVLVDFGEGSVSCSSAGFFEPLAGESVRCLQVGPVTVMIGPAAARTAIGTVTGTGSPTLTVLVGGVSYSLPYLLSYASPTINDVVLIDWSSGGVVVGEVTAAPSSSYTPPAGAVTTYTADFRAKDSGSYQSGSWNKLDVWCSDTNIGAWFYGTVIGDTIPNGAEIISVQVYVPEFYNAFPTSLATIGMHSLATKAGAPTVTNAVTISKGTGWKTLPDSFGDSLKTGTRKGLGTDHGGYHKFTSRSADADSGKLRITWRV